MEVVVTKASDAIVTALNEGPATARDLSQRIEGVGYANIRQSLVRLAKAGVVTKLRRGLYGLTDSPAAQVDCDTVPNADADKADCDTGRAPLVTQEPRPSAYTLEHIERAIAAAWEDFEAMNDPMDPRAWATLDFSR
ncbi:hypothetical protein HKCCSP123_00855 [Rhodobacterales bacterium HKCCSP123]|nr:hypothetical protein [Rhodobacterales bacterium HKCCSP123]